VKSFQDNSFTNAFHRILNKARPSPLAVKWSFAGVSWQWNRHSYTGQDYAFSTEVHRLLFRGSTPWLLLIVFEKWYAEHDEAVIRQSHWSKLLNGQRRDVLAWFKQQESEIL
jgi:hypothetical protein